MTEVEISSLCLLLEKPSEPLIIPKGDNDVVFEVPQGYYNKKYRNNTEEIKQKFETEDSTHISVKNVTIPVNLVEEASQIEKFSVFIPKHMESAVNLIQLFINADNLEDLLSLAAYCRERISPLLFNYALSVAILHREDTKDVSFPSLLASFPGKFVEATVFSDVRREANLTSAENRDPIVIKKNFTATNREPEQAVAYFREDIGINLHHWHWHLVYPFRGGSALVNKDRRGELFFYMHEQILARYNTERLCNNLDMVKSINLRESITEGYFPKLTQLNSNRAWPPRLRNSYLKDLDRPSDRLSLTLDMIEQWMGVINDAIRNGQVVSSDGTVIPLDPIKGIDILGNLLEASDLSVNRALYGNLHNMVHVLIAFCHDPQDKYLESFAVMGDTATAMRDPIFYRWHNTINAIFVSHKKLLPPYTASELGFQNVSISNIYLDVPNKKRNEMNTFWEMSDVDISSGLDFVDKGPVQLTITYLQHGSITFTVIVNNASNAELKGTVRLFMSPKYNRAKKLHAFETERQLMIELDKFMVTLKPGTNTIKRQSSDSSVTINYQTTFSSVSTANMSDEDVKKKFFCGCGWPDNMLIPKGSTSTDGFKMNFFAMVSDYSVDRVDQNPTGVCLGADSYCGLWNSKYPDSRSMGYPFDRPSTSLTLPSFLTPNMKFVEVTIRHVNTTVSRPASTKKTSPGVVNP